MLATEPENLIMLKAQFDDFGVELEIANGGSKRFKYLSLPRFQALMLKGYSVDSGILPPGTLAYKRTGKGDAISLFNPSCKQGLYYLDRNSKDKQDKKLTFNVPMPALVWFFRVDQDKHLSEARVFAVKDKLIRPTTMLYGYPFSNTFQDGKICFGSNDIIGRKFPTLLSLAFVPRLFHFAPFNGEIDNNIPRTKQDESPTLSFFKEYNNKNTFPLEILKPHSTWQGVWNAI